MRQKIRALLLASSGISASVGLACIGRRHARDYSSARKARTEECQQGVTGRGILATSALRSSKSSEDYTTEPLRTYKTAADEFYAKHGSLPTPTTVHSVLTVESSIDGQEGKNIFVIGDVHGCFDEMMLLHQKAVIENDNKPFQYVILVGDLCNKGPKSVRVIHHVRGQSRWLAIRGNHDDAALKAALGDTRRREGNKYQWVTDASRGEDTLTDEDVEWLSELPYSIRIPGRILEDSHSLDTVIVHAGLIPNLPLEDQTVETMVTLRGVQKNLKSGQYAHHGSKGGEQIVDLYGPPAPWASVWKGPHRVVFGHDARRGLQRYDGDLAIGLDTGACYGKKLTGLILPERRLVSVDALEVHCPISQD